MAKGFAQDRLKEISANLSRAFNNIENHTREGLQDALEFIKQEAQDLTSIDTGVLIKSASYRTWDRPWGLFGEVGYKAGYAVYVHEMPETTNWQRPGAENRFLEKAVVRNIPGIINRIARKAEKPPL